MKLLAYTVGVLSIVFGAQVASASRVRALNANDKSMQTIYLSLGRSTVLRFDEKPKTAVIGNQNFFSLEYIGNDLTIQPLGNTTTNLFVYTESQTYGLILRVGGSALYDDLVHVHFRPGYLRELPKGTRPLVSEVRLGKELQIKGKIRAKLLKLVRAIPQGIIMLDLEIRNLSGAKIVTSDLSFKLFSQAGNIPISKLVTKEEALGKDEKTQARIIVRASSLDNATLSMDFQGTVTQAKLSVRGLK